MSFAWRALRHRNFRLFFGGQTISLIGTWMTRVATGWLVYRLTGSALLLARELCRQIPTFLLRPSPAYGLTGSTGGKCCSGRKRYQWCNRWRWPR